MKDSVYTKEVVQELVDGYTMVSGENYETRSDFVGRWAEKLGVSVASVRSKLTQAGVYKKKEETKTGASAPNKVELVQAFSAVVGKDLKSLGNASQKDLLVLWEYVRDMNNKFEVAA